MTTFSGSKRTRIPVSTGRLSSREADLLTRAIVSTSAARSTGRRVERVDVGELREVLRRVGVDPVARCARRDRQHRLLRHVLERRVARRAARGRCRAAADRERRPRPRRATSAAIEARSEISMSVAASVSSSPSARRRMPPSTSTEARLESARATRAAVSASASRETRTCRASSTTVSESIMN